MVSRPFLGPVGSSAIVRGFPVASRVPRGRPSYQDGRGRRTPVWGTPVRPTRGDRLWIYAEGATVPICKSRNRVVPTPFLIGQAQARHWAPGLPSFGFAEANQTG